MLEVEIVLFLSFSKEIFFCNSDDYLTPNKTAHGIVYKMFARLTCCFKCCYYVEIDVGSWILDHHSIKMLGITHPFWVGVNECCSGIITSFFSALNVCY